MQTITVICHEKYPDPLIYTVQVADPKNQDEVWDAVFEARCDDLGCGPDYGEDMELYDEVKEGLRVLFAFNGDLHTIADWRE